MDRRPPPIEQLGRQLFIALRYRSELVDTSVGPVHRWVAEGGGTLPPLVLFHGFGSSAMNWMPLMAHLRPHVRSVVAIDLPGHGFSYRPDQLTLDDLKTGVLEAMDAGRGEPAVLVGNSLGGATAVRYAAARPDDVRGMILFSPAGAPMGPDDFRELQAKFRIDGHEDAVRFVRRLSGRALGLEAHLLAPMLRRSLADPVLRQWLASVTPDQFLTADEVGGLTVPIEVVWGRQERILPASGLAFWRSSLPPGSELLEPEGFGHTPYLDDRRWTAATILAFAERLAGVRPAE